MLRAQTSEVGAETARYAGLVADMLETMDAVRGVGLAAPQIGVSLALFTYDDREGNRGVCFDPVLEVEEGTAPEDPVREGCLSVPEVSGVVERAGTVRLTGRDADGQPLDITASGLLATIFQHEVDHLNGHLFVDRLRGESKKEAMRQIRQRDYGNKAQSLAQKRAAAVSSAFGAALPGERSGR